MKLFLLLLRANRKRVVLAALVSIASGAASAGLIALVNHVWDSGEATSPAWLWSFIGILVFLIGTGVMAQLMVLDLSLKAMADLRMQLCTKILGTPLRHLEDLGAERVYATLTEDVNTLSQILPNIPRFIINITTMLAGAAYMAWLSPAAFGVIGAFVVVGVLAYRLLWNRTIRHTRTGREHYDSMFGHFGAMHEGLKQLKLSRERREVFLGKDLDHSLQSYRQLNMAARTLFVIAENVTRIVFFGLLGMLIFFVPRLDGIDPEVLTGLMIMALYLYRPLGLVMEMVPQFGRALVSLEKVDSLGLSLGETRDDANDALVATPTWKSIELKGATYSYRRDYDDHVFTMGPIDVSFQPGELVFVVGGNGSGKTTFAKILTSLYPMEKGELRLDGELVTEANQSEYRQLFSAVFADYHLFPELIGGDGQGDDLDDKSTAHLRELELDHKVTVKDGVLSTTDLSQGQRRRLALLSAYLEDRPFYLFDEWTADQDPAFKDVFYTKILPELKARGKGVLVITHDDRYMHVADRCLMLEDGKMLQVTVPKPSYVS